MLKHRGVWGREPPTYGWVGSEGRWRRVARTEATELRINGTTETVAKDSVLVEQRDTLIEVTTITIDRNEAGEIKTMPSGDNRMDTAFWEINVSDNSL